jgi:hypothetical protein
MGADTVLNILLGLVALTALIVTWSQLRLQRTTAGGRGLLLGAGPTGTQIVRDGNVTQSYRVEVSIVGPKVWHELAACLEKDGREFEAPNRPDTRKSMSCDSERIIWDFYLSPEDGEKVWCLVSWAEPRGPALRTDALATPLCGDAVYKWRWRRGHLYIGWLSADASQHGPAWFRERFGRPRPLGRWRKYRDAVFRDGNGPLDLGRAPDG